MISTLILVTSAIGCLAAPEDGDELALAAAEAEAAATDERPWSDDADLWPAEAAVSADQAVPAGPAGDELGSGDDVFATAVRYCDEDFDCPGSCACISGTCTPFGFSPLPSPEYCAQPPQRACSSGCRYGCGCVGGFCQPSGFGPLPPVDYCVQPPPDGYESNDHHTLATSYLGSPQSHNFHERGDSDWILVYFGYPITATFETYNLASNANTYLAVYTYDYANRQLGALVGANDDVCGSWWSESCWASRVVATVPGNSIYAIQIFNTTDASRRVYDQTAPGYDFRIY